MQRYLASLVSSYFREEKSCELDRLCVMLPGYMKQLSDALTSDFICWLPCIFSNEGMARKCLDLGVQCAYTGLFVNADFCL